MSLGPAEILVVLVIALLVFGPTRLPEVGRQVGRTMREFRKFQETIRRDVHEVLNDDTPVDVSSSAEPPPSLPPKEGPDSSGAVAGESSAGEPANGKGDGA